MKTKLLLYCTKAKPYLYKSYDDNGGLAENGTLKEYTEYGVSNVLIDECNFHLLNGTIPLECECEVEEISCKIGSPFPYLEFEHELPKTCLTEEELENYLNYKVGYALHLTNIKSFEKPLELSEFYNSHLNEEIDKLIQENETLEYPHLSPYIAYKKCRLTNAPQNMFWCFGENGQKYCLISIRPEWLCKILNGEKTIEVRRKILKGML